jgi:hypothetical protein
MQTLGGEHMTLEQRYKRRQCGRAGTEGGSQVSPSLLACRRFASAACGTG